MPGSLIAQGLSGVKGATAIMEITNVLKFLILTDRMLIHIINTNSLVRFGTVDNLLFCLVRFCYFRFCL